MNKFKVGDKVVVTKDGAAHAAVHKGDTGVVERIIYYESGTHEYTVRMPDLEVWYFTDEDLEHDMSDSILPELPQVDQHQPGAKLDSNKPDLSLLLDFGRALEAVGEIGTGGAIKYTRGGWQSVPDGINRYTAAMLRHLMLEGRGEFDGDLKDYLGKETLHAAHAAWNALARLELILREKE
jgi:hypothetical protein